MSSIYSSVAWIGYSGRHSTLKLKRVLDIRGRTGISKIQTIFKCYLMYVIQLRDTCSNINVEIIHFKTKVLGVITNLRETKKWRITYNCLQWVKESRTNYDIVLYHHSNHLVLNLFNYSTDTRRLKRFHILDLSDVNRTAINYRINLLNFQQLC